MIAVGAKEDKMYHWYLLAKTRCGSDDRKSRPGSSLVAGGGPDWKDSLDDADRRKMLGLGAIETLPLIGCPVTHGIVYCI